MSRNVNIAVQLKEISDMMTQSSYLSSCLFNLDGTLFTYARERLLTIANFWIDFAFCFLQKAKVFDIVLSGSMCSYVFDSKSDINIFIVTNNMDNDNLALNIKMAEKLSAILKYQPWQPYFCKHIVNIKFICAQQYRYTHNTYSIMHNKWISKPMKLQYPFSAEQLLSYYQKFEQDLQNFVINLERDNKGNITQAGYSKLNGFIGGFKFNAFKAREYDSLHEYCPIYNIYKLARRCKLFNQYIKTESNA